METDIAQLQRRLRRGKFAIYSIIAFLFLLTIGVVIMSRQISQEEAMTMVSNAKTFVAPRSGSGNPAVGQRSRSNIEADKVYDYCPHNVEVILTNSCPSLTYKEAWISCRGEEPRRIGGPLGTGKCMDENEWQIYARQVCECPEIAPTSEPEPTVTPTSSSIDQCKAIYWPEDVHEYGSEPECMQRCPIDFPGRECRANQFWGQWQKSFCVNIPCTIDGMNIFPMSPGEFEFGKCSYAVVRKENSCPARDFLGCMKGYECSKTPDGMEITKVSEESNELKWMIGENCACTENIRSEGCGSEIIDPSFCEHYNENYWQPELQVGETIICSFTTLDCAKK